MHKETFLTADRGDRLRPPRGSRSYWHLKLLLDGLREIVNSELLEPGHRILDYGCGNKPYESLFNEKFEEYIGADLPSNKDANLILGPAGELPVEDESFDCILSSEVLEHTAKPQLYLKEAFRVLKRGGFLIISAPGIWVYHPDPIDYWRWTVDGLEFQIRAAGFEIISAKGVFGPESCALQLWQDSTFERLPTPLQSAYVRIFQGIIGMIERRHPDKVPCDASTYIFLGRKGF